MSFKISTAEEMENTNSVETSKQSRLDAFKYLLPQIISASIVSCFCILYGLNVGFPAILIANLNKTNLTTNEFAISENEFKWFVSSGVLVTPITALVTGVVVDYVGRLNSLRLAAIPCIAGWILLSSANNIIPLILGRIFTTFASSSFLISIPTYIAEISSPNIRGTLLNLMALGTTFGIFSSFLMASYVNWRTITVINITLAIACCIMSVFLYESTLWLITKARFAAARKSLTFFNRYNKLEKENFDGMIECELQKLKKLYTNRNDIKYSGLQKYKIFLQPCGYKPLLIVIVLYFFREYTGHTIIVFHLITIFKEFGTNINPYYAAVYITTAKVLIAICNVWLFKKFYRRTLLLVSCTGMAISIMVAALGVKLIKEGLVGYDWISLCGLIFYFSSCTVGIMPISCTISAELFPTHIRGTGQAIGSIIHTLCEVSAIQCYYLYKNILNVSQILLLFGLTSLLGSICIYTFVPETHRKILAETENYYSTPSKQAAAIQQETDEAAVVVLPTKT